MAVSYTKGTYSFNGTLLPFPPWEYVVYYMALLHIDNEFYMIHSDWIGGYGYCIDTSTNMLYSQVGISNTWKFSNNSWTKITSFAMNTPICPKESVVWSLTDVKYRAIDGIWPGDIYLTGSEPQSVSNDNLILEVSYTGGLKITTLGNTGIYIKAQARDITTGTVFDINNIATFQVENDESYVSFDNNKQIIIDRKYPLKKVRVNISWAELPEQKAILEFIIEIKSRKLMKGFLVGQMILGKGWKKASVEPISNYERSDVAWVFHM